VLRHTQSFQSREGGVVCKTQAQALHQTMSDTWNDGTVNKQDTHKPLTINNDCGVPYIIVPYNILLHMSIEYMYYECRLKSSCTHLITPTLNFVEVR
jgi:hypothetical protein